MQWLDGVKDAVFIFDPKAWRSQHWRRPETHQ